MDKKISVIVPVYNAEGTLQKCVHSIQNQQLYEIEIILIDDGSTDNSKELCDELAAKESRIKVIHLPKNQGASNARNIGLDNAQGEYIAFVDADDWIKPNMYANMYSKAKEFDSDIVFCAANVINQNGSQQIINADLPVGAYSVNEFHYKYIIPLSGSLKNDKTSPTGYVWSGIYRRQIINNIRFDTRVNLWEDELFIMKVVLSSTNIYIDRNGYYTYEHAKMGTLSKRDIQKYWPDFWENSCLVFEIKEKILYAAGLYNKCIRRLETSRANIALFSIKNESLENNPVSIFGIYKNIKNIISNEKLQSGICRCKKEDFTKLEWMLLKAIKFKLAFILVLYSKLYNADVHTAQ